MIEILELDDDYGIFDWPDAVKVYHHGDYSMATRRYTYRSKSEADLEAENEKLRELAKEACELARAFYDCGGTFNDLDDLLCEASELGIEVDA